MLKQDRRISYVATNITAPVLVLITLACLATQTTEAGLLPGSGHEVKCKRGRPVNLLDHVPYGPKLNCYVCKCPDGFVRCEQLSICVQRQSSSLKKLEQNYTSVNQHPRKQPVKTESTAREPIRIGQITYDLAPSSNLSEHNRIAKSVLGDKWLDVRESFVRRLRIESKPATSSVGVNFSGKLSSPVEFCTLLDEIPYGPKTLYLTTHSENKTWETPCDDFAKIQEDL